MVEKYRYGLQAIRDGKLMRKQSVDLLVDKGVHVPAPAAVQVDDSINTDRISGKGVRINAGSKLFGDRTLICEGAELGYEGPVTLKNCYIGPNVKLKGGYFENAVFLEGAEAGSGAHVRGGTILEEQANIAHTVGLKQTILFPYVTLGSLINFCDCLMTGGTSRKNHSEVGSSYIHFNYTPNQDKATPSIMGDVPRGVMLNQSPIFLGGQGGLVGPSRLEFGTVVAAGTINRKDQLKENHLVLGEKSRSGSVPYSTGTYYNLKRILRNNFLYIGNIYALRIWYFHVRAKFVGDEFSQELWEGLVSTLMLGITERLKQLSRLADKLAETNASAGIHHDFQKFWHRIQLQLETLIDYSGDDAKREFFLEQIVQKIGHQGKDYLRVIKSLDEKQAQAGTQWLDGVVTRVTEETSQFLTALI